MAGLRDRAQQWAAKQHNRVNQMYDQYPYSFHLDKASKWGDYFIHHIADQDRDIVHAAISCHDTLEDCHHITYNNVKNVLGETVAELVYAVTNEKGRTRKDRANNKYYRGIRNTRYATFVKLCDKLANVEHGLKTGSSMVDAYRKEYPDFHRRVYRGEYKDMFLTLEVMLGIKTKTTFLSLIKEVIYDCMPCRK